jgi:hypothetical protein
MPGLMHGDDDPDGHDWSPELFGLLAVSCLMSIPPRCARLRLEMLSVLVPSRLVRQEGAEGLIRQVNFSSIIGSRAW